MKDILTLQLLHQPVSDQLVIFGSAQPFSYGLKGHHEAHEILIGIELLDVFFTQQIAAAVDVVAIIVGWQRSVVTAAQFGQSKRVHAAFQVQMQLCLGKARDEIAGFHQLLLAAGCLFANSLRWRL